MMRLIRWILLAVAIIVAALWLIIGIDTLILPNIDDIIAFLNKQWIVIVVIASTVFVLRWYWRRAKRGKTPLFVQNKHARRWEHFHSVGCRQLSSLQTLIIGVLSSLGIGAALAWLIISIANTIPEERIVPAMVLLTLFFASVLFVPGLVRVAANHAIIPVFLNDYRIRRWSITEGPAWLPWYLGFSAFTGFVPDRSREDEAPEGQIFTGRRNLLPQETSTVDGKPPSVPSREIIETLIPTSGLYRVNNAAHWQRNENPEATLRDKVLETLRLAAAKFHFNDLLAMKSVISGMVRGECYLLVVRIKKKVDEELAGRVIVDENANRLFELVSISSAPSVEELERELEQSKMRLLEAVNKKGGDLVPRAPSDKSSTLTAADVEVIYVADGLLDVLDLVGVHIDSIQIPDATPAKLGDNQIFNAAAEIEVEILQRRAEMIQAETRAQVAKRLADALGVSMEEAARLARIDVGVTKEIVIAGNSGPADRLAAGLFEGGTRS